MRVLGVSAFYHDSAAALLTDGEIIAAAQEERFTRKKHDLSFPVNSIRYCLETAGLGLESIDYVVFYEKPGLKFRRLLETYFSVAPNGFQSFRKAMKIWLFGKLNQKDEILNSLNKEFGFAVPSDRLLFAEHHESHSASAFYPSPFEEAVVLTMDGVGEWATASVAVGNGADLTIQKEIHFPHSLGLLYSAFSYYAGFKVNSGEYKLMGLAPYGQPRFKNQILDNMVDVRPDGSFKLNMKYFNYCTGLTMTSADFGRLFGRPRRLPEEPLEQFHMDIAASIQEVTEEIILRIAGDLVQQYGIKNLCLAGGVALNCVANGKLLQSDLFENIWVQPAAGDAGGALGAALIAYYRHLNQARKADNADSMKGSYLGPEYSHAEIEATLRDAGAKFIVLDDEELFNRVTDDLIEERAFGWMQGRMEFGPRALGNRSIIADPRSAEMQKKLNLKVKFRESFRPFAPSILNEDVSEWFEFEGNSPYMLMVADVKSDRQIRMSADQDKLFGIEKLNVARSEIPAVTHVDYSARIQTVSADTNSRYHKLISRFKEKTGCPVLVNTSFNVRGEPIVRTPADAFRCFMGTGLDNLVIGNCYLRKEDQDPDLSLDYKNEFELD